jgi:hypothetical protein
VAKVAKVGRHWGKLMPGAVWISRHDLWEEPFWKWTSGKALETDSFRPNPLSLFLSAHCTVPVARDLFNSGTVSWVPEG